MRVCLIIEGAYPYVQGGMSNWVQQLMLSMPDVDFVVQTIAARRGEHRDLKYPIPPNCREIEEIYLQDDDYVGRRTQRRLRMTGRDYLALEGLVFGAQVDWDGVFRFFDRRNVSLNALLAGEDFLNMTLAYYEKNYVRVPFTDFLWSMRSMYLPLFSILKSRPMRADFYHSASGGYAGVLGSMQRSLYQKPFLMSEHGFYTREREEEIIKADWVQGVYKDLWIAQFRKIGACCYRYASRVTALYEGGRQIQIESGCPAEKTLVIPNGINPARFQSAPQKAPDDPFIHVGALLRVTPIKDVKTMIRAYALAKERCPRLKLWIMGPLDETPDYAAECMELAGPGRAGCGLYRPRAPGGPHRQDGYTAAQQPERGAAPGYFGRVFGQKALYCHRCGQLPGPAGGRAGRLGSRGHCGAHYGRSTNGGRDGQAGRRSRAAPAHGRDREQARAPVL